MSFFAYNYRILLHLDFFHMLPKEAKAAFFTITKIYNIWNLNRVQKDWLENKRLSCVNYCRPHNYGPFQINWT